LLTHNDRYVVEMLVPQEWFHDAPSKWDAAPTISRLMKAMQQLEQRAPTGPPGKGNPVSSGKAEHTVNGGGKM